MASSWVIPASTRGWRAASSFDVLLAFVRFTELMRPWYSPGTTCGVPGAGTASPPPPGGWVGVGVPCPGPSFFGGAVVVVVVGPGSRVAGGDVVVVVSPVGAVVVVVGCGPS